MQAYREETLRAVLGLVLAAGAEGTEAIPLLAAMAGASGGGERVVAEAGVSTPGLGGGGINLGGGVNLGGNRTVQAASPGALRLTARAVDAAARVALLSLPPEAAAPPTAAPARGARPAQARALLAALRAAGAAAPPFAASAMLAACLPQPAGARRRSAGGAGGAPGGLAETLEMLRALREAGGRPDAAVRLLIGAAAREVASPGT